MVYTVTKKADQLTTRWAGGQTAELFIHPPSASYADRTFDLRVSTATVELDSSRFTDLTGYKRLLMLLEGELRLSHELQYDRELTAFDVEAFDGGWHTRSFGRCTDLGVIYRDGEGGWRPRLRPVKSGETVPCVAHGYTGVFSLMDATQVALVGDAGVNTAKTLDKGDFIMVKCEGETPAITLKTPHAEAYAAVVFTATTGNGKDRSQ